MREKRRMRKARTLPKRPAATTGRKSTNPLVKKSTSRAR